MAKTRTTDEIKRIDALGRLNLGKSLANEQYRVERTSDGTIVLVPVAVIPKRELWLWKNKQAMDAVQAGLTQSARGETRHLGSFGQYADDEVDD